MAKRVRIEEQAEYSAAAPRKKSSKRTKLIVLLTAAVLVAVGLLMLSLYVIGVFDGVSKERRQMGKKSTDETETEGFTDYIFNSSDMPLGQYADFVLLCDEREYKFTVYLFSGYAPNTVSNFVNLVQKNYYNGKIFKTDTLRDTDGDGVYDKGILIGGSYIADANGQPMQTGMDSLSTIKGEFKENDYKGNILSHTEGVISMYRDVESEYDSARTDFFFCPYAATELNGKYAAFGKITTTDGIKALKTVSALKHAGETVTIKSITVERR